MKIFPVTGILCSLLLSAAACVLPSMMADNGTIGTASRGAGGIYIGTRSFLMARIHTVIPLWLR